MRRNNLHSVVILPKIKVLFIFDIVHMDYVKEQSLWKAQRAFIRLCLQVRSIKTQFQFY